MKFITVILAFTAMARAELEYKAKSDLDMMGYVFSCTHFVHLNAEQMTKINNNELPDEEEVRKYILCIVTKIGVFSEESGYLTENMAKYFEGITEKPEALAIIQGCADKKEQGSSVDVWAYRGLLCLIETRPRLQRILSEDLQQV